MKYKYIGVGEVNLPKFGITVKEGETFETAQQIDNPDFEPVSHADEPKEEVKTKKAK